MDIKRPIAAAALFAAVFPLGAQTTEPANTSLWTWRARAEIRANYRDSNEERFVTRFVFPPAIRPPGQTNAIEETVDPGHHAELSVANLQLDLGYGTLLAARAKIHAQDKYRRNPTTSDKKIDADELWVRIGDKPEFLDRPEKTSFFLQLGKAPKMERQPTRLLESYGLASTVFNRFEDVQALVGGSVGRNLYWRLQLANGNPLFFRDPNALAGDNGTNGERAVPPTLPPLHSGFPILYNAEVEEYFFNTKNLQFGQALGYRWQNGGQTFGFDFLAFHYRRSLADEKNLTGTFYGGDIDLLNGPFNAVSLPIHGRKKEETGGRLYSEWHGLTTIIQYTKQSVAGLGREGYELETGYRIPTPYGWLSWIQPAGRYSGLRNGFRAAANKTFPAPSVWWPWTKIDYGVRIGFVRNIDLTVERAKHLVGSPRKLDLGETLVTLRVRV